MCSAALPKGGISPAPLPRWALPLPSAWQPTWGPRNRARPPALPYIPAACCPAPWRSFCRAQPFCVDATHPYAVEATKNIRAAANAAGVEYHRLLRAASTLPAGSVVLGSAAQAAQYLTATQGNVLLTTGAKELAAFAGLDAARLYPRVLPTVAGITACEGRGHPAPQYHCHAGALYAGTEPCTDAAVPHPLPCHQGRRQRGRLCRKSPGCRPKRAALVVLRRPEECGETAEEILQRCRELL